MRERKQYEPVIVEFMRDQTINEIYVSDVIMVLQALR